MNEIKNSIVSSIVQYLNNLQYLAVDDKKSAQDILLLIMCDDIYDWCLSNNYDDNSLNNTDLTEQLKLENLRKKIINNNPKLINPIYNSNLYYKNVNTPQTVYTWQRVYDSVDLNKLPILLSVDNDLLITENGDYIDLSNYSPEVVQIDNSILLNNSSNKDYLVDEVGNYLKF